MVEHGGVCRETCCGGCWAGFFPVATQRESGRGAGPPYAMHTHTHTCLNVRRLPRRSPPPRATARRPRRTTSRGHRRIVGTLLPRGFSGCWQRGPTRHRLVLLGGGSRPRGHRGLEPEARCQERAGCVARSRHVTDSRERRACRAEERASGARRGRSILGRRRLGTTHLAKFAPAAGKARPHSFFAMGVLVRHQYRRARLLRLPRRGQSKRLCVGQACGQASSGALPPGTLVPVEIITLLDYVTLKYRGHDGADASYAALSTSPLLCMSSKGKEVKASVISHRPHATGSRLLRHKVLSPFPPQTGARCNRNGNGCSSMLEMLERCRMARQRIPKNRRHLAALLRVTSNRTRCTK